jgi:hypothetical protein
MASKQAIATALKGLSANYRVSPDPDLPDIWLLGLQDVGDADLLRAIGKIVAEDEFFPKLARVRNVLGLNRKTPPDVTGILERIRALTTYHPNTGDTLPRVETVRDELGDAIANAYGFVGPNRLQAVVFGGSGVGADIAGREFADALEHAQEAGESVALPPVSQSKRLTAGRPSVTIYGERPAPLIPLLASGPRPRA